MEKDGKAQAMGGNAFADDAIDHGNLFQQNQATATQKSTAAGAIRATRRASAPGVFSWSVSP